MKAEDEERAGRAEQYPGAGSLSPWPVRSARQHTRDSKREAVIRAAARAFSARGYHETSIDEIAAALNVTKPTIYYYVANKEQLLLECILTGLERVLEPFRRARPPGVSAREQLNETIRHYAQAIASEFGGCMVRAEDLGLAPASLMRIKELKSEIDHGIRQLLEDGVRDGSISAQDTKMTAFALAGALNWIAHWYRENRSMTAAQIAEAFVRIFNLGLAPRSESARAISLVGSRPRRAPRAAAPTRPKS
ncbi:MAG TPA: TetR/AcrR family transcriptional regulator [Steroidobacteraceae bacterium]|nr:TetR/AcrR family transcriptional regulator [Steroidobacteraceae bacterium]